MESTGSQKLKIKIGNAEFEAEGPTELLKEQFERFIGVVEKLGDRANPVQSAPITTTARPNPPTSPTITTSDAPSPPADGTETLALGPGIGDDLISRMFRKDADGVSLLALPRTDDGGADALVMILYGYQRLMSRTAVSGVRLMKAARQSGIDVPRVDSTMAKRRDFVLVAGAHRGRVYSLNNRGVQYAENVLRKTLE